MGSAQSSIVQQTVSVVNEAMTNLVTENSTGGTAKAINSNSIKINMKGLTTNCKVGIIQKITANQKLSVMSQFQSLNSMQTQMTTALQNAADQQSKSTQGALATALNVQASKQSINQAIANRVKTNVTQKNFASVNAFIQNLNKGELNMEGATITCQPGEEGIVVTQEIINNQIVEMLANAVIGNAVTGTTNASASASSTQAMESKQQGLVDALSGLISGPFIAIGVIIIVLAVLSFLMRGKISGLIEKKNSIDLAKAAQKFGRSFFGRASRR
jgi:hypothetical protein